MGILLFEELRKYSPFRNFLTVYVKIEVIMTALERNRKFAEYIYMSMNLYIIVIFPIEEPWENVFKAVYMPATQLTINA